MARVAATTGTVTVLVPTSVGAQSAYGPFVDVVAQHAGCEARSLLNTYFACGDLDDLSDLFGQAGLHVTATGTREVLTPFTATDGTLTAPVEIHIIAARR